MSDRTNGNNLELLLAEYVDRLTAGEAFNVEKIRADHPEVAEELIDQLRALQGLFQEKQFMINYMTMEQTTHLMTPML